MLTSFWKLLDWSLKALICLFLFSMMMITFLDVLGRYLFAHPVTGGFEIVQYLMPLVVLSALPLTTADESHLSVSLLTGHFKGPVYRIHRLMVLLVTGAGIGIIAWRLGVQAQILTDAKQVSGSLKFPLGVIGWLMCALTCLALLVVVLKIVDTLSGRNRLFPEPRLENDRVTTGAVE